MNAMSGDAAGLLAGDRYILISADCHAGGSMEQYRQYLDPKYRDEFDAWRGAYKNPFRDLQGGKRARNWDHERRITELESDGIAGEVLFPNTVPPFFPTASRIEPRVEDVSMALDPVPSDSNSPAFTRP